MYCKSDNRKSSRRANWRGQRGTSLIEVLTVLVILLIGIFIFIRIFPVGFASLQATSNRTFAGRLAQQQSEQLRSDQESLPKAVFYTSYDSAGNRAFVVGEDPDNLETNIVDPTTKVPNPYFNDVNKFRFIKGEPVKVPLPTAVGSGGAGGGVYGVGSVHTLQFGPIYMDATVGNPEIVATAAQEAYFDGFLRVYGLPLAGREAESGGGSNPPSPNLSGQFRNAQQYLVDYNDGQTAYILFAASNKQRKFFISFSNEESDTVKNVDESPLIVPANFYGWVPLPVTGGIAGQSYTGGVDVLERSVVVSRGFQRIAKSQSFSVTDATNTADPYEYKLLSENIQSAPGTLSFANIGVLAFNPAGSTYSERTPYGQRAFTALVDYAVLDWHIIREDREVGLGFNTPLPGGGSAYSIRTTLPFIKRIGDTEPDDSIYDGLYRDANTPVDLQLFDLVGNGTFAQANPLQNLGAALAVGDWNGGSPSPANADFWVDSDVKTGTYTTGRIYINAERVPRGSQIRVLYKAKGDWAVAVQKAVSEYTGKGTAENDLDYLAVVTPGSPAPNTGKPDAYGRLGTVLYFQSTELNKTMTARFEYKRKDGSTVQTAPVQFTAKDFTTESISGTNVKFATADISGFLPNLNGPTDWRIAGGVIQGVSVKSRVIYKDGDQTPVVDDNGTPNDKTDDKIIQKWRIQDVDTSITATPGS